MVRSDGRPNPWGPAIVGAILSSLLGGATAVFLWHRGRRSSVQQHAEFIGAIGVQTSRAGPVMESHRQEREAATALAVGESPEAQQAPGTEMNDVPPTSINDEIKKPRSMPRAHLPRSRISVDEQT